MEVGNEKKKPYYMTYSAALTSYTLMLNLKTTFSSPRITFDKLKIPILTIKCLIFIFILLQTNVPLFNLPQTPLYSFPSY